MDVIFELLRQLAESLENPVTFMMVMALVALSTVILVRTIMRSVRSGGFWSTIYKDVHKDSKEFSELRKQLAGLIEAHTESASKIVDSIQELREDGKGNHDDLRDQMVEFTLFKKDIEASKTELLKQIDDIKDWLKMHDVIAQQSNSNIKELLQKILEILAKMNVQIEKVDEFVRSIVPEFRADHKEITRGISDLSTDIALIERTIQTQMSNSGLKLRQ